MLSHLIGVNLSDKVDMIAPVAATLGKDVLSSLPGGQSMMMVHGEDDLVPYHARETIASSGRGGGALLGKGQRLLIREGG